MISLLSRISVAAIVVIQAAQALGNIQYPVGIVNAETLGSFNFSEIFAAYGSDMSNGAWARDSWNGLTTFARAPPLRCFGADSETPYDVAVLGAPFDTATSFRPG